MSSLFNRRTLGACVAILAVAGAANADLTVRYHATSSELVLFGQQQESPFGRVRYTVQIRGSRLRTEMTDHFGRRLWLIADREKGEAFGLDPEARTWWRDPGVWTCANIPAQVARGAAQLLATSGITDLDIGPPAPVTLSGARAHKVEVQFEGKVLGAPQPVSARLVLFFAADETRKFGAGAAKDLYCGTRPTAAEWSRALQDYLKLSEAKAAALAKVVGLPLQIELNTDLGLGRASVTLAADEITDGALPDETFTIPADFRERQ